MNIQALHIIVSGLAAIKCFFFFFIEAPEKKLINTKTEKEIDQIMESLKSYSKNEEVKEMIRWVMFDAFKNPSTYKNPKNHLFFNQLETLRKEFLDYYFEKLNTLVKKNQELRAVDIHSRIGKYIIQVSRLRMVIEPEIQIAMNVHTLTKIEYIAAKGFWINDSGKKIRKFTKSLGRVEEYPGGRKDKKAYAEAEKQMQEIMYEAYKESYSTK
jgi:hypothetical protein